MRAIRRSRFIHAPRPTRRTRTASLVAGNEHRRRWLANVRDFGGTFPEVFFGSRAPKLASSSGGNGGHNSPNERTLKLGKTVRILHERLPTLLVSPLPQEILSPQITLHLFPSTLPHLPTATGRLAYKAAIWTAPVAWGRFPVVGNVRLVILSERMVKNGNNSDHDTAGTDSKKRPEKLVVRWKTCAKENGKGKSMGDYYRNLAGAASQSTLPGRPASSADEAEFSGIFIFEFDEDGRIVSHTIENVQEGGSWDKMPRVISVTDWLLGKAWAKSQGEGAGLALNYCNSVRSGDSVTAKIAGKRR